MERCDDENLSVMESINKQVEEAVDETTANRIFDRYVEEMTVHMPAVVFPPRTTACDVRSSKPIVFLAILVAASVGMAPLNLQHYLTRLLLRSLADFIIRMGEKSMDLIQALLIATIWYRPPKRYEHMNFYQLSHIAVVMAVDIGLGKRVTASKTLQMQATKNQNRSFKHLLISDSVEARRTWLGCYFMCAK